MPANAEAVARSRAKIHDAAVKLFTRKGYHGTGMREIAREAGVSLGNAYNHHKNKQDLFAGLLEEYEDEAIWDEIVACLQPFLDGLGEEQRAALEMTDLGSMTQAEAAAEAGISVAGMKSRVQRARRQLLHDLQECCAITVDGRGRPIEWRSRAD